MKKTLSVSIVAALCILNFGCATMKDATRTKYCNDAGALEKGANDAKEDWRARPEHIFSVCDEKDRERLTAKYLDGYAIGKGLRDKK